MLNNRQIYAPMLVSYSTWKCSANKVLVKASPMSANLNLLRQNSPHTEVFPYKTPSWDVNEAALQNILEFRVPLEKDVFKRVSPLLEPQTLPLPFGFLDLPRQFRMVLSIHSRLSTISYKPFDHGEDKGYIHWKSFITPIMEWHFRHQMAIGFGGGT